MMNDVILCNIYFVSVGNRMVNSAGQWKNMA